MLFSCIEPFDTVEMNLLNALVSHLTSTCTLAHTDARWSAHKQEVHSLRKCLYVPVANRCPTPRLDTFLPVPLSSAVEALGSVCKVNAVLSLCTGGVYVCLACQLAGQREIGSQRAAARKNLLLSILVCSISSFPPACPILFPAHKLS